ncbi:MAG: hypothetical protein WBW04_06165 [Nitrolancea sp.]
MAATARVVNQPIRTAKDRARLEKRASVLYLRLGDGYDRIERALADGEDVARWDDLWKKLLREYEEVCDLLSIT